MERKNIHFILLIALMLSMFCVSLSTAGITLSGGHHEIDYEVNDWVLTEDSAEGEFTTLDVLSGAVMEHLIASENSQVDFYDGSVEGWIYSRDNSVVNIYGGTITTQIAVYKNGSINMTGGEIGKLWTHDNGKIDLAGGIVNGWMSILQNSNLTIYGSDFKIDNISVGYGDILSVYGGRSGESERILTGTLANGDPLNTAFYIYESASISLVPEPATLLLFGLGGLVLRKCRQV